MSTVYIAAARWPADLKVAHTLLRNYEQHLRNGPAGATHICIEGYDAELAELPKVWGGPDAALLLAWQRSRDSEEDQTGNRSGEAGFSFAVQNNPDLEQERPALRGPQERAIGCVAVHLLPKRPGACELKRMWVEPAGRGMGLGRRLLDAAVAWAREHGAGEMLLDTAPGAMPEAGRLYASAGFSPYVRYNSNPVPGIVFLRLPLG